VDGQGALVFTSQARERSVTLPAGLRLERGQDYLWTVQARAEGHRSAAGAAEFRRIAEDVEQRVREGTRDVVALRRDPAQAESSAEEVLLALVLEQAGLREAAQRQWQALVPLRPALAAARPLQP
jgi:hypothetical protein